MHQDWVIYILSTYYVRNSVGPPPPAWFTSRKRQKLKLHEETRNIQIFMNSSVQMYQKYQKYHTHLSEMFNAIKMLLKQFRSSGLKNCQSKEENGSVHLERTITESKLPKIPAPPRTIVTTEFTRANWNKDVVGRRVRANKIISTF